MPSRCATACKMCSVLSSCVRRSCRGAAVVPRCPCRVQARLSRVRMKKEKAKKKSGEGERGSVAARNTKERPVYPEGSPAVRQVMQVVRGQE